MKILVPLKRVPDPDTRVRLNPGGALDTESVPFVVNPFDAIALEEALRWKEKIAGVEVVVITVDAGAAVDQLRTGLAMGADRAVLVRTGEPLDSLAVAKVLAAYCRRAPPELVLMGKQATDDDCGQTGQMLAALLARPQATFVSKLELQGSRARCVRETDAGLETVAIELPAVVTVDLRLNEPRYVALPGILRARKKPIEEITPAELGIAVAARTTVLALEVAERRRAGERVPSIEALAARLRAAIARGGSLPGSPS